MVAIDLAGQTAVVTGASQGLGATTARLLYEAGANVVVNFFRDPDDINMARAGEVISAMDENRAAAIEGDVRDRDHIAGMLDRTIDRFGGIDIVVNNAGILRDRTLKKMAADEWQSVIDTNLTGVFNVSQAAASRMRDGGRIVNFASIAAAIGFFGQANYAAAKAGVVALTKVLSRELARQRIRVNAVAPGVVLTDMGKSIPEAAREQMLAQIPLARFGEPEEISKVVLFLCSDLSSYVTGQTIHVNGGWWSA